MCRGLGPSRVEAGSLREAQMWMFCWMLRVKSVSVDLRYAVDDGGRRWRERAGRGCNERDAAAGLAVVGWEPWMGRGMSQVSGCSHCTVPARNPQGNPPAAALAPVGELFKSVCWDHGMPAIACLANGLAPVGGGPVALLCDGQLPARCRHTQDTPTGLFRAHSSFITASSHIGRILLEDGAALTGTGMVDLERRM